MIFIAAGMGGGTGTGAAPVVAQVAKEMNILTVGIVTKPFEFEGKKRMEQAERGIATLRNVDALVVIQNERLRLVSETKITLFNAFAEADNVLKHGVQSISDLIYTPGLINLDFEDVCQIMRGAGSARIWVSVVQAARTRQRLLQRQPSLLHCSNLRSTVQRGSSSTSLLHRISSWTRSTWLRI